MTTECSSIWQQSGGQAYLWDMTLASLPAFAGAAVLAARLITGLARELRLTVAVWLALRGTRPEQRPEIIRALTGERV